MNPSVLMKSFALCFFLASLTIMVAADDRNNNKKMDMVANVATEEEFNQQVSESNKRRNKEVELHNHPPSHQALIPLLLLSIAPSTNEL